MDQDPEIIALLGRMNKWWEDNPFFSARIDTVGRFMDTSSTMYYYVDANNRRRYIGETTSRLPFASHFIFTVIDGVTYYLFPDSASFVTDGAIVAYETFIQATLGDLSQTNVMLNASKSRGLRTVAGRNELFMKMDSAKLGIGPSQADIDYVLEYDSSPRIIKMKQIRLGLEQLTTYTYLTLDRGQVLGSLPPLPPLEQARRDVSFDAALKKDILHFRMLQSQGA